MFRIRVVGLLCLICAAGQPIRAGEIATLTKWMTGSFSSAAQAQAQADADFFDIGLETVPIWTERKDGSFHSAVYELPDDPLRFAGAWREPARLDSIGPEDLKLRQGCAVILASESRERFTGSTRDKQCRSTLRGASYTTSHVTITAEGIRSWDRGFADTDEQVWGAEKGPYIFLRTP